MISKTCLKCRCCNERRYPFVKFIGTEFAFECSCCGALHLFYESLHFDIEENFKQETWNRYIGYWQNGKLEVQSNVSKSVIDSFTLLLQNQRVDEVIEIQQIKLSNRERNGKFFIASMLHDHFQEALRAVYQMKGHIEAKTFDAYNILIVPLDRRFKFLLEEKAKLKGIDEVWVVPFDKRLRWPYINSVKDASFSWSTHSAIQSLLDKCEGLGVTITKRAGAVPNGKEILKNLLEPLKPQPLYDNSGQLLTGKYVGILFKQPSSNRAGLFKAEQFEHIKTFITNYQQKPLLVLTNENDRNKVEKLNLSIPYVYVPEVCSQAQVFKEHIRLVIGTNCSGCNIPCLYDIPLFSFAKGRRFPDDFYCFARMASKYDPDQKPWFAALEKPDTVYEQPVELEDEIEILKFKNELEKLLEQCKKNSVSTKGKQYLENGYNNRCPDCGEDNLATRRSLLYSDIVYSYHCKCGTKYIAYYGLTTCSLVGVFKLKDKNRYVEAHKAADELRRTTIKSKKLVTLVFNNKNKKKEPIFYYAVKSSIADLYYTLPCLKSLKDSYPEKAIVVVTHKAYKDLIPKDLVDRYLLIDTPSPSSFHQELYSPEHKSLESIFENHPICNNYPGTLPVDHNSYYELRQRYAIESIKTVDVVIACRLGKRIWPTESQLKELIILLEQQEVTFQILTYPLSENIVTPQWLLQLPNVIMNPTILQQIQSATTARVWVTAHGASEVIPCITNTSIVELETTDPWWKNPEPQPLRFGLPTQKFRMLKADQLSDIDMKEVLIKIQELL